MSHTSESPLPEGSAVTAEELQRLAEDYREAETRLAKAKRAVEADKARRAREGVLAQLSDAIRDTPEEWELGNATRVFEYARQFALDGVARWMRRRPIELALSDSLAPAAQLSVARRFVSLQNRRHKFEKWHQLVVAARKKLQEAASQHKGAATYVGASRMLKLPGSSFMSVAGAMSASVSRDEARDALTKLGGALLRHLAAADETALPDGPGVLEVVSAQTSGLWTWLTIDSYQGVAGKAEVVAQALEALELHLAQLSARTLAQLEAASAGEAVIRSYEKNAGTELPAVLQALAKLT